MSHWYLIHTKPKQELRAKEHLENQGINCYLPIMSVEKVLRGKRQEVEEVMFKNYIFIELEHDDGNWSKVRSTRGVRDFVRFGLKVAKVPLSVINQLHNQLQSLDLKIIQTNAPKVGEKVKVTDGAFKDLEGIFQTKNGDERSIILLNILNNSVEMDISNQDVIKLEN